MKIQSSDRRKEIQSVIGYVHNYLSDSVYYLKEKKDVNTALASISYAEGLIDALKLLRIVDFNWNSDKKEGLGKKMGKTVLATGAFDLLHYGHLKFLEESKEAGGKNSKLVVVVARDKTIEDRKGKKPVMPEEQRRALVESIKPVDVAILGHKDFSMIDIINKINPDIITVGHDQKDVQRMVEKIVEEKKLKIKIVTIRKFGEEGLDSSTKIKRKIVGDLQQ